MLASVYSYRVMAKSVSSCCVRGRQVVSNPVTYSMLTALLEYIDLINLSDSIKQMFVWASLLFTIPKCQSLF